MISFNSDTVIIVLFFNKNQDIDFTLITYK